MQVGERLHQVRTEVLESLVCGARFQGDEIEIDVAGCGERQSQHALRGVSLRDGHRRFDFAPIVVFHGDGGFGQNVAMVVKQRDLNRHDGSGFGAHPCGEVVGFARTEDHAVPTDVFQRDRGLLHFDRRVMRVLLGHRIGGEHVESGE